ncbi:MAG: glutathionylspermidine synthase family protein [Bacillota bacterium]
MIEIDEFYKELQKEMINNKSIYKKEYNELKEKVAKSSAYYHGEPVSFFYQPLLFNEEQYSYFKEKIKKFNGILRKVTEEFLENDVFRSKFRFPELMEELILVDPGYKTEYPVARFDFFYDYNNQFKFCELNTDGSSAMNEARVLQREFKDTKLLKKYMNKYEFKDYELFYSLIDKIIKNYKEFAGNSAKKYPNIGIMDFSEDGTSNEFKEFQKRFEELGYKTVICDPRDLKYTNGKLWSNDISLDLIYRRATTARMVENGDEINDFIDAYKNGDICVVGSFRSQIPHNKVIFAVLHDNNAVDFLDEKEKMFIKNHIPWTKCLNFDNKKLINKILRTKDKYVLKPCDMFAGKGVYVGKDYNKKDWENIIKNINENNDYLVQEFIEQPKLKMGFVEEDEFKIEDVNYILSLFLYNHNIAGFYARGGRENIIAPAGESRTMPCFVIREK